MNHKHPKVIRAEERARAARKEFMMNSMVNNLAMEVSMEIDREIIENIKDIARKIK